jgi:hypothetical protein
MFATNNDLVDLLPSIFDHGVEDFTPELEKAQADVVRELKIKWFNKFYSQDTFDITRLDDAQWTRAVCYRAIAHYILPRLSTWRVDDVFREQMTFYSDAYAHEIDAALSVGVKYDIDNSGGIATTEVDQMITDRLVR